MNEHFLTRRLFLQRVALGTAGLITARSAFARGGKPSPNEKLNLAVIGVAHRGGENLKEVTSENIVALCDVDSNVLDSGAAMVEKAQGKAPKKYKDMRQAMEDKDIDAITERISPAQDPIQLKIDRIIQNTVYPAYMSHSKLYGFLSLWRLHQIFKNGYCCFHEYFISW